MNRVTATPSSRPCGRAKPPRFKIRYTGSIQGKRLRRFLVPALLIFVLGNRSTPAERGQLDFSPSLFTVMAAINTAGYDAEIDSTNNDALRGQIRKAVASSNAPVIADLKKFFSDHRQPDATAELGQYVSWALSVGEPPDFKFRYKEAELPPDVRPIQALAPLLARFYREAHIAELWTSSQPAFDRALERYHSRVARAILEVNAYLRNPTNGYL